MDRGGLSRECRNLILAAEAIENPRVDGRRTYKVKARAAEFFTLENLALVDDLRDDSF